MCHCMMEKVRNSPSDHPVMTEAASAQCHARVTGSQIASRR